MLDLQTLSCLHQIPVIRSSTVQIQSTYKKAKDISALVRYPCDIAESVANKTLQVGLTVAGPLVQRFSGPVNAADEYAAEKIRQIELKYPVINTSVDDVMSSLNDRAEPIRHAISSFNDKTEPIRHAMSSVKDTTTLKIQYGKETVSNVATATVNKASRAAGSLYSFCGTHVPTFQRRYTSDAIGLTWLRTLLTSLLIKTKKLNDYLLRKVPRKPYIIALQRLFIFVGTLLQFCIQTVAPENYIADKTRRSRPRPQMPIFANRELLRPSTNSTSGTTNHSYLHTNSRSQYTNMTDDEDLSERLTTNEAADDEGLYSQSGSGALPNNDLYDPLTEGQQRRLNDEGLDGDLPPAEFRETDNGN